MSVVNVAKESVAGFNAGNGTVGTSPQALVTSPWTVQKHVVVRADPANTGTVKVGPNLGSASAGFVLPAGQETPPIYVDDLSKVFVIGSAAGQNYSFVCT
jgi:hypothetical protein